jgi:hypothetical protein
MIQGEALGHGRGQTNVKVTIYNPLTNEQHTEHIPVKSETFLPASNKVIK